MSASWENKQVKHSDGRTGVITTEDLKFTSRLLVITVNKSQEKVYIRLNSDREDEGTEGWKWKHQPEGQKARWIGM